MLSIAVDVLNFCIFKGATKEALVAKQANFIAGTILGFGIRDQQKSFLERQKQKWLEELDDQVKNKREVCTTFPITDIPICYVFCCIHFQDLIILPRKKLTRHCITKI